VNNAVNHAAPSSQSEQAGFAITVLFTTAAETLDALRRAAALAVDLNARVNLVNVQVVPYPLPLDRPPVYVEFLADRLRAVAKQVSVPVEIHLYFGRDTAATLASVLPADSVLVIGSQRRWWPSRARNLVRRLRRSGYQVVFAEAPWVRHKRRLRAVIDAVRHPFTGQMAHS
jgi:nucleotide-binding universal stress UspA family protein